MRRSSEKLFAALTLPLFALLLTPGITAAQSGTVRGRIADSTGAAISQAAIALEPGGLRATSRDNGDYAIGRVPSGTYMIRLRGLGYAAPDTAITVSEGQTVVRDFIVSRAAVALTEVVIGSRASHTAADELAVPGDACTPAPIKSQGPTEA